MHSKKCARRKSTVGRNFENAVGILIERYSNRNRTNKQNRIKNQCCYWKIEFLADNWQKLTKPPTFTNCSNKQKNFSLQLYNLPSTGKRMYGKKLPIAEKLQTLRIQLLAEVLRTANFSFRFLIYKKKMECNEGLDRIKSQRKKKTVGRRPFLVCDTFKNGQRGHL